MFHYKVCASLALWLGEFIGNTAVDHFKSQLGYKLNWLWRECACVFAWSYWLGIACPREEWSSWLCSLQNVFAHALILCCRSVCPPGCRMSMLFVCCLLCGSWRQINLQRLYDLYAGSPPGLQFCDGDRACACTWCHLLRSACNAHKKNYIYIRL